MKLFIYLHIYLLSLFKVDIINNGFSVLNKMFELCFEETDTRHNMTNQTVYNKTFIFFHSIENRPLENKLKLTYNLHYERINFKITVLILTSIMLTQGLVKGAILCSRNPYFYFLHGESISTAIQLTSPASKKSKDLNKVSLLLQDLY